MYVSTYLQDHLLTLPALPNGEKLRKIREEVEREAEERKAALLRQQEEARLMQQRQQEEAAASSRKENPLNKLAMEFSRLSHKGEEKQHQHSNTGWAVESIHREPLDSYDDPFEVHHQQLLTYLQQARQAGRTDEVSALEQSLADIEMEMEMRHN